MPRDSSGNYTLPPGINPVITNTTILSTWANPTLEDVATEMTDSLSRTGKGGMLAPFRINDGTEALPGLAFTSEPSTGIFRSGAGLMDFGSLADSLLRVNGNDKTLKYSVDDVWHNLPGPLLLTVATVTPYTGLTWWDTETGVPYIFFDAQWVPYNALQAASQGAPLNFPDAPVDDQEYDPGTGVIYVYDLAKTRWDIKEVISLANSAFIPEVATFTAAGAGVWTKPANFVYAVIELQGAGGAGGGPATTTSAQGGAGAGGGGGGYCKKTVFDVDLLATENFVLGAGGVPSLGGSGLTGGVSTFGTTPFLTANAGVGAGTSLGANLFGGNSGPGGTAVGGDVNISGEGGNYALSAGTSSSGNPGGWGGHGGNCVLGSGGVARFSVATIAGQPGVNGGGGSGGGNGSDESAVLGAAGGDAILVITSYVQQVQPVASGSVLVPQIFSDDVPGTRDWIKPANFVYGIVEAVGGGGGGAGNNAVSPQGGAAGGGGGYCRSVILDADAGGTVEYVVGAGGAGAPTGLSPGQPGNRSTFADLPFIAFGGGAGLTTGAGGGEGGNATGGDVNVLGGGGSGKADTNIAGQGGTSFFGGQAKGHGGTQSSGQDGQPGTGGGGSGGASTSTAQSGGAGGGGKIIITSYILVAIP